MSSSSINYPTVQAYYDGRLQSNASPKTFQTINPATAQPLATVETSSEKTIDAAITSAKRAFPSWSATPAIERSRILHKAAQLLRARNDSLATTETHDTGKPFSETSTVDVVTGADVVEFMANAIGGGGLNGERVQLRSDAWFVSTREPLGVCAGIGAWNYPLQIACWKSAPCLAAGNCMVYKPSEFTPLHARALADIYREAGLPDGVFNVVHGDGAVGAYLAAHEDIAKVSFTGQVSTGKKVAATAAGGMKHVTMELGGKSPCIILDDCPIDLAVDGAMMANFFSTGQVCTNGTRVFVPESLLPRFEKTLLEKMQHIRAGDPLDSTVNFGPLVSKVHHSKVISYISHGIKTDRAKLLTGGLDTVPSLPASVKDGYWVQPTVFTNCRDEMKVCTEEIFGPVMCILPYKTESEVLARANATAMGLAAGVFTNDVNRASAITQNLHAGIVWVKYLGRVAGGDGGRGVEEQWPRRGER